MSTKTVFSANVPQARGISIIIDQDQAQQVGSCKQQLEAAKISVYHLNTPPTAASAPEASRCPVSPKSAAATSSIDINRNSNHANGASPIPSSRRDCSEETGYATATFPQSLLLTVACQSGPAPPSTGERGKLQAAEEAEVGKLQVNRQEPSQRSANGTSHAADSGVSREAAEQTTTTTIIQCRSRVSSRQDHAEDSGAAEADDDANDDRAKHNEESRHWNGSTRCISVGETDDGQHSLAGSGALNSSGQQLPLEHDLAASNLSSLATKADCASALTESVSYAEKDSHVVKIQIKPETARVSSSEKQVTVLQLSDSNSNIASNKSFLVQKESADLRLDIGEKMVQRPMTAASAAGGPQGVNVAGASAAAAIVTTSKISSGGTTVTELNVSAHHTSPYLYYMMSSGEFSPCDTLDSGTGSDLESNGNAATPSPKVVTNGTAAGGAPQIEMHLKTTKIRVNGAKKPTDNPKGSGEHARAGSLTDSEESESSSLSCDSLHSSEFMRQTSVSPPTPPALTASGIAAPNAAKLGSFLPDSLLREICDRKFPNNDFETKYGGGGSSDGDNNEHCAEAETIHVQDYAIEHAQFLQGRNACSSFSKRASLPSKTFVLNTEDGTFVDTKMNSMPRKYEADKYYNFHVNEHENFRSFGHGSGGSCADDGESLSEYDAKSLQDDAFAGYKDIRCSSNTSTIRSSKGTVRGVKNRVRNGIATFLQMQQPSVKNYKEKDFGKVVLYTTSMGIVRQTYAKCSNVKQILRTLLVKFEERDVFMSVEYQQEIKERMHSEVIRVPQLFVEGQHIGDAETVERLNESGELRQLLKPYKSISTTYTCQTCGGYRLLPCPSCNGSKKSVHRNHFTAEFVALKCMNCDEVGLVKCHNC